VFVIPSPDGWIALAMARSVATAQHKGKGPGGTSDSLLNMIEYSLASNVTVGFLNVLLLFFCNVLRGDVLGNLFLTVDRMSVVSPKSFGLLSMCKAWLREFDCIKPLKI
jgi:hypothetical protein